MAHPLTSDDDLPAGLGKRGAASAYGCEKHVIAEQCQLNELPAVQRQTDQTLIVDDLTNLGIGCPHERRRFGDGNFFVDCAHRQRKIKIEMLPGLQYHAVADLCLESG